MDGLLEREELLQLLEEMRRTGGRLVFVGGEADVGKTALVRELAARSGARILAGACENLTAPSPQASLDVLRVLGRRVDGPRRLACQRAAALARRSSRARRR